MIRWSTRSAPWAPMVHSWLQHNPVVVTGLGVISAAGAGVDEFWRNVLAGQSLATRLPGEMAALVGCVAPPVEERIPGFRSVRKMDRSVQLAFAAAHQAWTDAGIQSAAFPPERLGVIAGTSRGPMGKWMETLDRLSRGSVLPSLSANCTIACLSGALSRTFHTQGPAFTVSAACASSAHAIALAAQQILLGAADIVLAGGAEAPLVPPLLAQLAAAGVLGSHADPSRACRPFARDRNGTVMGEGAAFLVLESDNSARLRGSHVYARLSGWGLGSEGLYRTGISQDAAGLRRVMHQALRLAQLNPDQVGYVNLHGTGTILNDRQEAMAVSRVFPQGVPCSSTKPVTGHCMGASAAMEAIIGIAALRHGQMPPSANCSPIDPDCGLDLIREQPRTRPISSVMSISSGFWGNHASLIFSAP